MKKLYYFSKSRLQFIEIKNYKAKLFTYFILVFLFLSSIIYGGYRLTSSIFGTVKDYSQIKNENELLKKKLDEVISLYHTLNIEIDSLTKENNNLRLSANLEPLTEEEKLLGVGGGSFNNMLDFFNNESDLKLKKAFSLVEEVSKKISFEKSQFLEISEKLEENQKLYASIPAIKPCTGEVALHGFGIRLHPILNIKKMHDGIDIITNNGTPVYAAGNGIVDFIGYDGGYGLTVEIEHGFGYRTIYAHLSSSNVKLKQKVVRGDLIAKTGSSGLTTGPHLHYEVHHNGIKQNPKDFFFDDFNFFTLKNK